MLHNDLTGVGFLGKRALMHMAGSGMGHHANTGMMMGDDQPDQDTLVMPGWFAPAIFIVILVFLPVMFFLSYTLNNLLPTLAMIEDPSPPAYEPLSTNPDDAEGSPQSSAAGPPSPVTSSIRQTTRMLRSIGGFRSFFRGGWCALVASAAMSASQNFFAAFMPGFLARLLAPLPAILVTLPLTTAWTHIVMSAPKSAPWWRRLPPARKTYAALWRPAVLVWLAVGVSTSVPAGVGALLGLGDDAARENPDAGAVAWKASVTVLVGLALGVGLLVPARLLFTRVQASLLPVEDEPIVPFDRSFGGAVEPEVVGGKGYASVAEAWGTFSRENWARLVRLYVKVIAVSVAFWVFIAAITVPMWVVALKHATREPVGN